MHVCVCTPSFLLAIVPCAGPMSTKCRGKRRTHTHTHTAHTHTHACVYSLETGFTKKEQRVHTHTHTHRQTHTDTHTHTHTHRSTPPYMILNRCKDVVIRLSQRGVHLGPGGRAFAGGLAATGAITGKSGERVDSVSWEVRECVCVR